MRKTVTKIVNANIYSTDACAFVPGELTFENGILIDGRQMRATQADRLLDAEGAMLAPGLVDVHTHGRAGADFGSADRDALSRMAHSYLQSGVTTLVPTLASAPLTDMLNAASRIVAQPDTACGARFAGVHIEGRYLHPRRRGAHAAALLAPLAPDEMDRFADAIGGRGVMHITAAFELDADGAFAARARARGATLALGHTDATYAQALAAEKNGISAYTHLFNAMPPLHHRAGGAVCAALEGNCFCELICDGFHVSPEMVRLAYRLKGKRLVLISDSMEATGCPDGAYAIAGMPVRVTDGHAYTIDGAIAGSTLNLYDGVHMLADFAQIPFAHALYAATAAPAQEVGIFSKVGSLDVGKRADFLWLDQNYVLRSVWKDGVEICKLPS